MDDVKARFEAIAQAQGKRLVKFLDMLIEATGAAIRAIKETGASTSPHPLSHNTLPARTSLSPRDWLLAAAAFAGAAAALVFLIGVAVRDNPSTALVPLKENISALSERLDKAEHKSALLADRVTAAEIDLGKTAALANSTIVEMKKMREALSTQAARLAGHPGGASSWHAIAAAETQEVQEVKTAGGHEEANFPPFDSANFSPLLVWLALSFGLLYLLMAKIAVPRVENLLHARAHKITQDISEANALRAKAEEAAATHEKTVADAKVKAVALAQETHARLNAETEAKRLALETELNAKLAASEAQVLATKAKAMGHVDEIARDTAATIVQHITGKPADQNAIAKALTTLTA